MICATLVILYPREASAGTIWFAAGWIEQWQIACGRKFTRLPDANTSTMKGQITNQYSPSLNMRLNGKKDSSDMIED